MIRKLLLMLTPVLVLAAFSVMPAFAQAETKAYGTCAFGAPQELLHCPEGEKKFTAFANGTPVEVLTEKAFGSGDFVFSGERGGKFECTDLLNSGTVENVAGVGHSKETLTFHNCFMVVEAQKCKLNSPGAGRGVIAPPVTEEVTAEHTVKVSVSGVDIVLSGAPPSYCTPAGYSVGSLVGGRVVSGTQAAGSNVLVFSNAKGLEAGGLYFGGAGTISLSLETYTEEGKPVVIN